MTKIKYIVKLVVFLFIISCNVEHKSGVESIPIISKEIEKEFVLPEVVDVATLGNIDFITNLNEKVNKRKTQVYNPTLLVAWREICDTLVCTPLIAKEVIELKRINDNLSTILDMDNDDIYTKLTIDSFQIKSQVYFEKTLPFQYEFYRNNYNLKFQGEGVASFGLSDYDRKVASQVDLLFYEKDEYGVRLITKDQTQEIILYKSRKIPKETFSDVVKMILSKTKATKQQKEMEKEKWLASIPEDMRHRVSWDGKDKYVFVKDDTLSIPVIRFNLEKEYRELIGSKFSCESSTYELEEATQRIGFVLDEKGAYVEGNAAMFVKNASGTDMQPKSILFDDAFFLLIRKKDKQMPYFAAWINDTKLMVKE